MTSAISATSHPHPLPTGDAPMSRPCSALLLLLGLASPGAAQAPSPSPGPSRSATTLCTAVRRIPRRSSSAPASCTTPPTARTARGWWTACGPRRTLTPASRPASAPGRPTAIVPDPCRRRCNRWIRGRCWAGSSSRPGATSGWCWCRPGGSSPRTGCRRRVLGGQRQAVHRSVRGAATGGHHPEIPGDDPRPQPGR